MLEKLRGEFDTDRVRERKRKRDEMQANSNEEMRAKLEEMKKEGWSFDEEGIGTPPKEEEH